MKDVNGNDLWNGCYAAMWSENQGSLLMVQVGQYNEETKKIKVTRLDEPGRYQMKTFWTPAYSSKFILLP